MSPGLNRLWLVPLLLLAGQSWALGLGDIKLDSSLNEPLRAEIELLAATAEELTNLDIQLASGDTFQRYDLDRPLFLTRLNFTLVRSGRADGNVVRITSTEPITEPFVTFLVEASWSRGRLLREYTILLDPPTFAPPPAAQAAETVNAPTRATQADSGQIQRPAPAPQQQPAAPETRPTVQAPVQSTDNATVSAPQPAAPQASFDSTPGSDRVVQRGDTLWGISRNALSDPRLTINQTMLAIYQANPDAFDGNINRLRAGATLRIPSADDVYRISRGEALAEVQRQNQAWSGSAGIQAPQPRLTLVPPDEEDDITSPDTTVDTGPAVDVDETPATDFVDPVDARIQEIEAILEDQDALVEIADNDLAALRNELAELRGEEPPVPEVTDDTLDDEVLFDDETDTVVDEEPVDDEITEPDVQTSPPVVSRSRDVGIVDTILGYLKNFWVLIGLALLVTVAILFWFMRRASHDQGDVTGVWDALDADDEVEAESVASTERLRALARDEDESFLVVETSEQIPTVTENSDSMEVPAANIGGANESFGESDFTPSVEDTFSSETAINLDQSDPIAEADFHMAYGLYDQAADLINGALVADPDRADLLAKLCEIYFVWGNRDAFVDAAGRLKNTAGGTSNPDWNKTVIMGQQIAPDHALFSGVSAEGATREVDLSFDGDSDDGGALDMNFDGGPDGMVSDVIDLGGESDDDFVGATGTVPTPGDSSGIDFAFDEEPDTDESITREMDERTVESPTVSEQFEVDATGEMPSLADTSREQNISPADATAEIDLADLGLDLDSLSDSSASHDLGDDDDLLDDLDDTTESPSLLMDDEDATGKNEALDDSLIATGKNPAVREDDATVQFGSDMDDSQSPTTEMPTINEPGGDLTTLGDDDATLLASLDDEDGVSEVGLDTSLLDATGQTQVLSGDMAVGDADDVGSLRDDAETLLASLDDDDDGDFDFARTEALPKDAYDSRMSDDDTGRMPGLAGSTDLDLDLDDLTAALKISEVGDTVNQSRDDATVEQPRIRGGAGGDSATGITQQLDPEDLSSELHEARTMTEVGTKLDLARAYVDMGDPSGARSILEEVLDEGDDGQKQQAQKLLDSLPS